MLLDLVSPWCAAVEASPSAQQTFRQHHAALLEQLRQHHTPHLEIFPLYHDLAPLQTLRALASAATHRAVLTNVVERANGAGITTTPTIVLVPSAALIEPFSSLAQTPGMILLPYTADTMSEQRIAVQLARGLALVTRRRLPGTAELNEAHDITWDPWAATRTLPLREWIYAEGIAWHFAASIFPELTAPQLFGVSTTAWQRLREREGIARTALLTELDALGIGPLLRWLPADGMTAPRTAENVSLLPRMGHYLAWRLTAPRVERVGVVGAMREGA